MEAGLDIVQMISAAGQCLLVVVVSFVVLTAIASFVRFQMMTDRNVDSADSSLAGNAFKREIFHRLGTAHRVPPPLLLMLFESPQFPVSDGQDNSKVKTIMDDFRVRIGQAIRASDFVTLTNEGLVGVLIQTEEKFAQRIINRLSETFSRPKYTTESGRQITVQLRAGAATFPANGEKTQELLDVVRAALRNNKDSFCHLAPPDDGKTRLQSETDNPTDMSNTDLAIIDKLTGVLRAAPLPKMSRRYMAQRRKQGIPVSMIRLDVDYLDRYNEHYGQAGGDTILKGIGALLEKELRETDLIGRPEDDEFLVVHPGGETAAMAVANRLNAAIRKTQFTFAQAHLKSTASFGVAWHPPHGGSASQLFKAAGVALRSSQNSGRSACVGYNPRDTSEQKSSMSETF